MSACRVCKSPDREEIDRYLSQRESIRAIAAWTEEVGRPISRPTIGKHLAHSLTDESILIEEVKKTIALGEPGVPIKRVAPAEYLQAVVDAGAAKVEANPGKVSVDQAIRAADVLERKRDDGKRALQILVLALTGHPNEQPVITGEYRELR